MPCFLGKFFPLFKAVIVNTNWTEKMLRINVAEKQQTQEELLI